MGRLSLLVRISSGLVALTLAALLALDLLGLVPRAADDTSERRARLSETLATQVSAVAGPNDSATYRLLLRATVEQDEELLSAALRGPRGELVVVAGEHVQLWQPEPGSRSTVTHVQIPLLREGKLWRKLELRFTDPGDASFFASALADPLVHLLGALGLMCFVAFVAFMARTLRHLDPSAVIPTRLQAALDVMAEGVVILDRNEQIVLANAAFAARAGSTPVALLGAAASSLDWRNWEDDDKPRRMPWIESLDSGQVATGDTIRLVDTDGNASMLVVNSSPVLDGWGKAKGAIITLDDVSELERKSQDLARAMTELEKSRDEIRLQNQELLVLATTDPLSGVANRRSFFEESEDALRSETSRPVSFVMVDIDHFKKVNDSHGHATGDNVIKAVAHLWRGLLGTNRVVCRYGGEEFCVRLDGHDAESARAIAERVRQAVAEPGFTVVPISASFGVFTVAPNVARSALKASSSSKAAAEAINRADQALYSAKQSGRNRVVVWHAGLADPKN